MSNTTGSILQGDVNYAKETNAEEEERAFEEKGQNEERQGNEEEKSSEEEVLSYSEFPNDSIEAQATAQGWNPNGPKTAQQFLEDGKEIGLKKAISQRNDRIHNLEGQISDLKNMLTSQQQMAYQAAVNDLRAQREVAIQEGDVDGVYDVEDQMQQLGQNYQQLAAQQQQRRQQPPPAVQDFFSKHHGWIYENSDEADAMKAHAQLSYAKALKRGFSEQQAVELTEQSLHKVFPKRFQSARAPMRNVEGGNMDASSQMTASRQSGLQLNDFEKAVGRQLVERGVYNNLGEYAKELQKSKKPGIEINF